MKDEVSGGGQAYSRKGKMYSLRVSPVGQKQEAASENRKVFQKGKRSQRFCEKKKNPNIRMHLLNFKKGISSRNLSQLATTSAP